MGTLFSTIVPGVSLLHACAKHTFLSLPGDGLWYILFVEITSWDLLFPPAEEECTLIKHLLVNEAFARHPPSKTHKNAGKSNK